MNELINIKPKSSEEFLKEKPEMIFGPEGTSENGIANVVGSKNQNALKFMFANDLNLIFSGFSHPCSCRFSIVIIQSLIKPCIACNWVTLVLI